MNPKRRYFNYPEYIQLLTKKKAKSAVWTYFGLPANESGQLVSENLAICTICNNPTSCTGGTTSNLFSHLKLYHPKEYADINSSKQKESVPIVTEVHSIDGTFSASEVVVSEILSEISPTSSNSNSEKQCTNAITKFIATTIQPYNIVESPEFIEMLRTLNPTYKLPQRKFFSQTGIPKLYNDVKDSIRKELNLVKCCDVSITIDSWTSLANKSFIAVTAHFIDAQWILKSACLSCIHFDEDYTADNIREFLIDILSSWNLNVNLLCSCTTESKENILKVISLLEMQHVPCFGQTINIAVNRALQIPILQKAITRLKELHNTILHSQEMSQDLVNTQKMLQMEEVKLPNACPTQWWSILKLCHRFLENQLPINKLLHDYSKKHLVLEASEVSAIENLVSATKFMESIMKNLSEEDYTSASSILPLLTKIKKYLQIKDTDNSLLKKLKKKLFSAITEQYYENDELMGILELSTLCDPRFRLNYVENSDEIRDFALSKMTNMYKANIVKLGICNSDQSQHKDSKMGLAKILDEDEDEILKENKLPSKKAENELNNYLGMPKTDLDQNPFIWWRWHEHSFPTLKILAKKFLAIQGTSIPPKRVFSSGGSIINKNRASLSPKNGEMQIFLTLNKCFI